jgi:hypothetical protein
MDRSTKTAVSCYSVSVACDHLERNLQVATSLCHCCFVRSQMHLRLYSPSCAVCTSGDLPSSLCLCIRSNITFFRVVNLIVPRVFISKIKPIFTAFQCLKAFCLRRHYSAALPLFTWIHSILFLMRLHNRINRILIDKRKHSSMIDVWPYRATDFLTKHCLIICS